MKPQGIKQAEMAIWASIVASALMELVNKWIGAISNDDFARSLIVCAFICIIPYKIGCGSNAARYFYAIVNVFSVLAVLGGGVQMPKLDLILSILLLPLEVFILYRLFHRDAAEWFGQSG